MPDWRSGLIAHAMWNGYVSGRSPPEALQEQNPFVPKNAVITFDFIEFVDLASPEAEICRISKI
jgi:hypothetical protein